MAIETNTTTTLNAEWAKDMGMSFLHLYPIRVQTVLQEIFDAGWNAGELGTENPKRTDPLSARIWRGKLVPISGDPEEDAVTLDQRIKETLRDVIYVGLHLGTEPFQKIYRDTAAILIFKARAAGMTNPKINVAPLQKGEPTDPGFPKYSGRDATVLGFHLTATLSA